jgi:excisionase family DNA binding protein
MEERRYSLKEAQDELRVSERTIHRWIKSGKLKSYKPGRDHQIPESAIRKVLEESEVRPKVQAPLWPEAKPEEEPEAEQQREQTQGQWQAIVKQVLGADIAEISVPSTQKEEWETLARGLEELVEENERLKATVAELREELTRVRERA